MESWNGKPYHSFDYMLKERFSCKIYKTALNGGMTCPNRDGTLGSRGCIFCSQGGAGDFAGDKRDSITQQINKQAAKLIQKETPLLLSLIFRLTPIPTPPWNTWRRFIRKL